MRVVNLLKMMRGKIDSGWTQGCSARSHGGFPVVPYSDDARCWCLTGSMTADRVLCTDFAARGQVVNIIMKLLEDRNEKPDIALWNDAEGRTKEQVLELLDEAIQVASVGGYC